MNDGLDLLHRIARLWQVDAGRVVWSERGFDWWPGSFKVSVTIVPAPEDQAGEEGPAWRLTARTALVKGIRPDDPETRKYIAGLAFVAPSYAVIYPPAQLKEKYPDADDLLWMQSTVYLREDNVGWLPEFFSRMAILQPIDAQMHAEEIAAALNATPDISSPEPGGPTDHQDGVLSVADELYLPTGKEASRWAGTSEFEEFAERLGRNDGCFGMGDPSGLTLETPFGENSNLIRLETTERHPYLGNGLLASLLTALSRSDAEVEAECAWLNYLEAGSWTGFPQLGSWVPLAKGDDLYPGHAFFIPNLLFQPNLATNAALWQMARARWLKQTFHAHLQDRTMMEILQARRRLEGRGPD